MKRIKLLSIATLALVVIGFAGGALAQVPSLVTQQLRLSTGGATPNYVQLRGITGAAASTDYYQLDQAPAPTAGTNYSMWLNDQNQIKRSNPFGLSQQHYLLQVNALGNGLQWVDPSTLTTLNGDIIGPVDSTLVNVGHSGLDNRLIQGINDATGYVVGTVIHIDRGGTNSIDLPAAGAVAYGDGTKYMFTAVGTQNQILKSNGVNPPSWTNVGALITVQNGLTRTGDTIELGGTLIHATNIDQSGFNMNFINGSGTASTMTIGNGTNTMNLSINPGAAGNVTMTNIPTDTTAPSILALDGTGRVRLRSLASLVTADNGLIATGNNNVSLGSPASSGAPLLTDRFVSLATHTFNFEGTGSVNVGTGNDVSLNVNTGTAGNVTIQGATLNSTSNFNNIAFVDTATNQVRRAKTSLMTQNNAPSLYLAIDATGNIVKSISPTTGITRGQIAGTGTFTYTSPAINILAGASITASVENHTGISGAIVVQVTAVTTGAAGTFSVESSESIQSGSFINYVVMNP